MAKPPCTFISQVHTTLEFQMVEEIRSGSGIGDGGRGDGGGDGERTPHNTPGCTCGWKGESRERTADALADLDNHARYDCPLDRSRSFFVTRYPVTASTLDDDDPRPISPAQFLPNGRVLR